MKKITNRIVLVMLTVIIAMVCFTFSVSAAKVNLSTVSYLKASQTDTTITLTWKKVENARGYRVFEMVSGKWQAMVTTTSSACILTDLKPGSEHSYAVRAYSKHNGKTVWARNYKTIDTATRPSAIKTLKSKNAADSVTLIWNKTSGATGYRIYRYNTSIKSWKIINKSTMKTSVTAKQLSAGKTYTFAVKPYYKSGNGILWAKTYKKITVTIPAQKQSKLLEIESSGYNAIKDCIILDISSDGWNSGFAGGTKNVTVVVDGKTLKVPCKIPSTKNADGRYEVVIDLNDIRIKSGLTVTYIIDEGIITTKDGLQYNAEYRGSCDVG